MKTVNKMSKLDDLVSGVNQTKGTKDKVIFTASPSEMSGICGSSSDAIEVRLKAERGPLQNQLKRLGYYDVEPACCINHYHYQERRRNIFNEAKAKVKHIGDKAVKKWTDNNIKSYLAGDRDVHIDPKPMKTQLELDGESL